MKRTKGKSYGGDPLYDWDEKMKKIKKFQFIADILTLGFVGAAVIYLIVAIIIHIAT